MRVAVGEILAHCEKCGGEEFQAIPPSGQLLHHRSYSCTACEARYAYAELLMQIGDKAIAQAKASTSKW